MTKLENRCPICNGINPPHGMDEYHKFLQQIQMALEHLEKAKELSYRLPSIKIPLEHSLDSVKKLNEEGLIC